MSAYGPVKQGMQGYILGGKKFGPAREKMIFITCRQIVKTQASLWIREVLPEP